MIEAIQDNIVMCSVFLILGIIIGASITAKFSAISKNINFYFQYLKSRPIEAIVGLIMLFLAFGVIFHLSIIVDNAFEVLSFISSILIGWVFSKYSTKLSNEKIQKELASISYKYSVGVRAKLTLLQSILKKEIDLFKRCSDKENGCAHIDKLNNIEHILHISLYDIESSISDWKGEIWEEFECYEKISNIERSIESVDMVKSDENSNSARDIDRRIKELEQEKNLQIKKCGYKIYNHIKSAETNRLNINKQRSKQADLRSILSNIFTNND